MPRTHFGIYLKKLKSSYSRKLYVLQGEIIVLLLTQKQNSIFINSRNIEAQGTQYNYIKMKLRNTASFKMDLKPLCLHKVIQEHSFCKSWVLYAGIINERK